MVIRKWTMFSPRNLRKPLFQSRIFGAVYNISCNMFKCEQNLLKDIDIYNIFFAKTVPENYWSRPPNPQNKMKLPDVAALAPSIGTTVWHRGYLNINFLWIETFPLRGGGQETQESNKFYIHKKTAN